MNSIKNSLNKMFIGIMILLTRKSRYFPEIKWSPNSWTHNLFRFYELLLGRRFGIKAEMSAQIVKDKNGKVVSLIYRCHSFESIFALAEQKIRGLMPEWKPVRIWIPKLASVNSLFQPSPFMFAIAFDATAKGQDSGVNSVTLSFTCTGSNLMLMINTDYDQPLTITSYLYNSVAFTDVASPLSFQGGGTYLDMQYLAGPSTGANNIVCTWSSTSGGKTISAASYSGVKQSAPSATSTKANQSIASPLTQSITTVDDNSWIVWGFGISGPATASTNCTIRQQDALYHGGGIADTNTDQTPAGSKSMSATYGGNLNQAGNMAALSPFVTSSVDNGFFSLF